MTMYNEPYRRVVDSLAGIYRSYYELISYNEEYKDRVQVVMIADGYDKLSKDNLKLFEKAGIYNAFRTSKYKEAQMTEDRTSHRIVFKGRCFGIDLLNRLELYQQRRHE